MAHNYAISKLYLGNTDRVGAPSPSAWRSFGYNLDGLVTTPASTDVCQLTAGASTSTQVDGVGGIDNSFGENVLPIVLYIDDAFSDSTNRNIQTGRFTISTYVVGFDDSAGNSTTAEWLTGALLTDGDYRLRHDAGPAWDLTTAWPVLSTSLNCGSTGCEPGTDPVASARVKFSRAFQVTGEFVNETTVPVTLEMLVAGQPITLNIQAAVVAFQALRPGAVTNGTIAGVLNTSELVSAFMGQIASPTTSLCFASGFQSVSQQVAQAADIVLGGDGKTISNSAGQLCNAISIGIGFDAVEIALPTAGDVVDPVDAGCDDGK